MGHATNNVKLGLTCSVVEVEPWDFCLILGPDLFFFFFNNAIQKDQNIKLKCYLPISKLTPKLRETKGKLKKKEVKRQSKARSVFGVDGEEMAGLVGDGCQRHSKVEIGAGESDLGTREAAWWERRWRCVGGGLCNGGILLMRSAALMVGFQLSFVSASDLVE